MESAAQEIPQLLREKGWGLYERPPKELFDIEESIAGGPVTELVTGRQYDLLPRVSTKDELDKVFEGEDPEHPKLVVPEGTRPSEARSVAVFSDDEEHFSWPPGNEILWAGLEFMEGKVRLFTPHATQTFMAIGVFVKAIESMEDIKHRLSIL